MNKRLTLPQDVELRLDLRLTDKSVDDSIYHGRVFYEVGHESGVYLTNHGRMRYADDPHAFTKKNMWYMYNTLGKQRWNCMMTAEFLEQVEPKVIWAMIDRLDRTGHV